MPSDFPERLQGFLIRLDSLLIEADDILDAPADAGLKTMVEDLTKRLLEIRDSADEKSDRD